SPVGRTVVALLQLPAQDMGMRKSEARACHRPTVVGKPNLSLSIAAQTSLGQELTESIFLRLRSSKKTSAGGGTSFLDEAALDGEISFMSTTVDVRGPEASRKPAQRFDRSIVEGPIGPAVWRLAWPTMLQNVIAGLQGIIDHVMVGHFVGYTANAAIGVSWQIMLVVIVFISSLFTGMAVLVARFAGANEPEKVNRVVYQA